MGRKYTVEGSQEVDGSGGAVTETMLVATNPSDLVTTLTRIRTSQRTHLIAELYLLEVQRASAAGSGGSAPTPSKKDLGDPASTVVWGAGPTSEPTYSANTLLFSRNWNSTLGMEIVWTEDEGPVIPPDGIVGIKITAPTGTTAFTPECEVEFTEKG